jgi:hypothetical protein
MDSLRGKLLLASPTMADPNFSRSVILIAEHTEEGAMGLVLNRPAETMVSEAVPDLAWLTPDDANVFVGGPVAEFRSGPEPTTEIGAVCSSSSTPCRRASASARACSSSVRGRAR